MHTYEFIVVDQAIFITNEKDCNFFFLSTSTQGMTLHMPELGKEVLWRRKEGVGFISTFAFNRPTL